MGYANLVFVAVGTVAVLAGLYYTARSFSGTARDRAIADACKPLEREITELKGERAELNRKVDRQADRINLLEDELRRRQ